VSTRCHLVAVPVDGKTEVIRAQVSPDLGAEDAAALGVIIAAARLKYASESHPEPEIAECQRCGAGPGVCCIRRSRFMPDGFTHRERHAAAIALDGRTCAGEEGRDG
jgi:hypothetical protein